MSAGDDGLPRVPETVLELNLRGLRSYVAEDDDDIVMVLEEAGPGNDTAAITLEPGIGAAYQDAIDGAEALARTATAYAALLRARANSTHLDGPATDGPSNIQCGH